MAPARPGPAILRLLLPSARAVDTSVAAHFDEELWYGADALSESAAEAKAAKSIAAQVGRIIGTKPFPIAAQRLSELTRNQDTHIDRVVEVLESDPALSARLLRLVNSAGFALRTSCTSVRHAAALVGYRRLNQVSTTAAILDMYDSSTAMAAQVLEHATIVGSLCRYLAAHLGLPPDEMFTCGFLHDIGKLMLLECEGDTYREVLAQYSDEADTVYIKERELYGYDHALLAGHVLAAWNIPAPVPKVVAWHHQVTRAYSDTPQVARMVSVLRLADALSFSLFKVFPEHEVERLARTEAASYLEISEPQLAAMWDSLLALAERARAGFRGEREEAKGPIESIEPRREHSPANDNETSPVSAPAAPVETMPRVFPCVVCGTGTFANTCVICHGYVCPSHQAKDDEWCALCEADYRALELKVPSWTYAALGIAMGAMFAGGVVGAAGAVSSTLAEILVAPGLLALAGAILLGTWHRWLRRLWLVRTAPDRAGLAPALGHNRGEDGEIVVVVPVSKRVVKAFDIGERGRVLERIEPESIPLSLRAPAPNDPFVSSLRPHPRLSAPPSSRAHAPEVLIPKADAVPEILPVSESNDEAASLPPSATMTEDAPPNLKPGGSAFNPLTEAAEREHADKPPQSPENAPQAELGAEAESSEVRLPDSGILDAPAPGNPEPRSDPRQDDVSGFDEDSWFDEPPAAEETTARAPTSSPPESFPTLVADSVDATEDEDTAEPAWGEVDAAAIPNAARLAPESALVQAPEATFRTPEAWRSVEALHGAANGW